MRLVYADFLRADLLKPGDLFEYMHPTYGECIVTVASVAVEPCFDPKYPDYIHIQADYPREGRIAVGMDASEMVQMVEPAQVENDPLEAFRQRLFQYRKK